MHDSSGVGCVLIDPYNKKNVLSFHLEFECTNKIAEYKSLVLGLKKNYKLEGRVFEGNQ